MTDIINMKLKYFFLTKKITEIADMKFSMKKWFREGDVLWKEPPVSKPFSSRNISKSS